MARAIAMTGGSMEAESERRNPDLVAIWDGDRFNLVPAPDMNDKTRTLIRVIAAGVCGTDLHVLEDRTRRLGVGLPISLGHEILGEVLRVGASPRVLGGGQIRVGDRVALVPGVPCGTCRICSSYGAHEHLCEHRTVHGFSRYLPDGDYPVGGYATALQLADGVWLQQVPDRMNQSTAVLAELVSVGIRAVERGAAGGRPDASLGAIVGAQAAVIGLGPVGAVVALVLRSLGADVRGFESDEWRTNHAKTVLGIDAVHLAVTGETTREREDAEAFDLVFECAGVPDAFVGALVLARRGGRVVEVGHFFPNGTTALDPSLICRKDLDILGTVLAPPQAYPKAMRLLQNEALPFKGLVTTELGLDELHRLPRIARTNTLKTIIKPQVEHHA